MVNKNRSRRGLAPVELVLAIPLVMFVLALSVIIGSVASWKVRGEVVARDAIFGRRWPRGGRDDPPAVEWRVANAARSTSGGAQVTELDHPVFQNPLIRGPLPGNIAVNSEMLDPQNHQRVGHARLTRAPAALARLGSYTLDVRQPLIDGKWQFWQLGYAWNGDRRLRRLYDLLNVPGTEDTRARYQQTQQELLAIYNRPEFFVLDRDDEFLAEFGPVGVPNFHRVVQRFDSLDTEFVRQRYVPPLVARVKRVPRDMTDAFLGLYQYQLSNLPQPPAPMTAAQAAMKAELEQKIEVLREYRQSLN